MVLCKGSRHCTFVVSRFGQVRISEEIICQCFDSIYCLLIMLRVIGKPTRPEYVFGLFGVLVVSFMLGSAELSLADIGRNMSLGD